ncbi:hypothetical protein CHS0354_009208 [Potamilus streckersoni]|uniref:HORMA domain-containing protein n=1 Tax=Potamilus streckersoni TaxID=2493646 RepID=A0AAE0W4H8_9BIVA|nr:hypothetical protein CHS0354_009208 [Potamilus streckersoni]
MTTATLKRQEEKTGTWSSIFPTEQVTETQSALFVKKLIAVAISNIAYLRAIFPEHSFGDRCLEDLNLKILRDDSSCPGACQVIKWVKGCFDALDKKYLKTLNLGIYVDPDNPDTVIESYTFKFSYTNQGGIDIYRNDRKVTSAYTASETKKATIRLLRTIVILTQTLKSLPDDVMMTMKLLYHDEVTPPDYEPPGFKAAETDNFVFEEEPMNIKVGDVSTNVKLKSSVNQIEDVKCQKEQEALISVEAKTKEPFINAALPAESPTQPGADDNAVDSTGSQMSEKEDCTVRCPCGCNEDDGLMIMCSVCKLWQHGVCFLILEEDEAPESHICDVCAEPGESGLEPTDPYLIGLSPIAVQATCLWRRTLLACLEMNRTLAPALSKRLGVEMTVAQGLMNRLDKEGFLKNQGKGKKLGKVVEKDKIRNIGIPKYMRHETSKKMKNERKSKHKKETDKEEKETENTVPAKGNTDEVEILAEKTKGMKIDGRGGKLSTKGKSEIKSKEANIDVTCIQIEDQENKLLSKRRGRKRAFSKIDGLEFDISCSQDDFALPSTKKKASIVTHAIMV